MKLIEYYLENDVMLNRTLFSETNEDIFIEFKKSLLSLYKLEGLEYYEIVGFKNMFTIKKILTIPNVRVINIE